MDNFSTDGDGSYTDTQDLRIGANQNVTNEFDGLIDDVRVYNRALSATEIADLYKVTKPRITPGSPDLVGYWPFNEGDGGVAVDLSGNGNDGALVNGPVWAAGKIGGALEFDGVDDYLNLGMLAAPHPLINMDVKTVSLWMKANGAQPDNDGMLINIDNGWFVQDWLNDQIKYLHRFTTTDGEWITPAGSISQGAWYHVAVVYDSTSAANDPVIYINGAPQSLTEVTAPAGTANNHSNEQFWLGIRADNPTWMRFNGALDDVRIYNRALSAGEIDEIYQAGLLGFAAQDCTNPNGAEGALIYNLDVNRPQYCDGEQWVRLGGP